jgi:hypothetical protein
MLPRTKVFDATDTVVENGFIRVQSHFYEVLDEMLTPLKNIILRILGITLFRKYYDRRFVSGGCL